MVKKVLAICMLAVALATTAVAQEEDGPDRSGTKDDKKRCFIGISFLTHGHHFRNIFFLSFTKKYTTQID